MLWLGLVLIIGGVVLLWIAADPFVLAAARLAHLWGVSPILVGALVIGFGTSAPELVVSAVAAARGELAESVGNVTGSNAANLSLVLGVSVLLSPVVGQARVIKREGLLTMFAMIVFTVVVWDGMLERWEGMALVLAMAAVPILLVRWSKQDLESGELVTPIDPGMHDELSGSDHGAWWEIGRAFLSLVGIVLGAWLLVEGGSQLADVFGLTGGFVGATIFALGTSLPELATAVAASRRHENELVIGNLLGSNLFNSLLVVGVAGLVGAGTIGEHRTWEFVVMMAIAASVGVMVLVRSRLGRTQGMILLALFSGFVMVVAANARV